MRSIGCATWLFTAAVYAQGPTPPAVEPATLRPPEESRLSTAIFRAGLEKRGLSELLELHLQDFPPADRTEELLMRRAIKLAESQDPSRSKSERLADLAAANRLLEELIAESREDPRRFTWQFELARSLLYEQAEPALTETLYYGHHGDDGERATPITTRALQTVADLERELAAELARIDQLSIRQFERLEGEGYVRELETLAQRTDYLKLWALYYDALPRDDDDPLRARHLNMIAERLAADDALLTIPHATSQVQVQSLLLAGMTHRLLNDHRTAREFLHRAREVSQTVTGEEQRSRVQWAVILAWLESIRNKAEDGQFVEALRTLHQERPAVAGHGGNERNLDVAAALLERWIYRLRAEAADRDGDNSLGDQYRQAAWQAVAGAVRQSAELRDAIYAALYRCLDPRGDPAGLDPIEQCALLAGLLADASETPDQAEDLLRRAVAVGERFLAEVTAPPAARLRPEVLYNLGVAEYRRGRIAVAADHFYEVASRHPDFDNAFRAATFAVQLTADLYGESTHREDPVIRQKYRDALSLLMFRWGETDAARYWRYYYAQLLDEQGELEAAAGQYGLVEEGHERFVQSLFLRARCLALIISRKASTEDEDRAEMMRTVDAFFDARRRFTSAVGSQAGRTTAPAESALPDDTPRGPYERLRAKMRLMAAEVMVLPVVDRPADALQAVGDSEAIFPEDPELAGRVWRVRLLAYKRLGRLDEATQTIPIYLSADPENAPAVLDALYESLTDGVGLAPSIDDNAPHRDEASMALVLAQQLYDWHHGHENGPPATDTSGAGADRYVIQLAEANLRAGHFDRARELLDARMAKPVKEDPQFDRLEARRFYAYAEASFQLGDYAVALPYFNRLAAALPVTHPLRWRSLLRDLQCRTSLDHPPEGIIQVIFQQKQLYPEMGGPATAGEFDKLLRRNQRRRDQGA